METRKHFAWLPKRVTSGKLVWLESYYELLHFYDPSTGKPPITGYCYSYTETKYEYIIRLLKKDYGDKI
jgi:hypothetical protein